MAMSAAVCVPMVGPFFHNIDLMTQVSHDHCHRSHNYHHHHQFVLVYHQRRFISTTTTSTAIIITTSTATTTTIMMVLPLCVLRNMCSGNYKVILLLAYLMLYPFRLWFC